MGSHLEFDGSQGAEKAGEVNRLHHQK